MYFGQSSKINLTFFIQFLQTKKYSTTQLKTQLTHHFTRMSMIAFYNNQSEPMLVDEYKLADPIEDDHPALDIIQIFPTQAEIAMELPKYIAYKGKKVPAQLNYGKVLANIFKDVYDIAEEKEAIKQKDCMKNLKFIQNLHYYVATRTW